MQHVVQLGINIDDDAIRRAVEAEAKKEIINGIKNDITNVVFERYYGAPNKNRLSDYACAIIKETIDEYRDQIIAATASLLANRIVRTKKYQEVVGEVLDEP